MKYFAFQWHITDWCDQRCKHCYIFSENEDKSLLDMPYEKMMKVIQSCEEMCRRIKRLPYFYITGGDPILHKDFWKLLEVLKHKEIPFTILGNPFHLNDDVCKRLKELGCEKYQMSIDGLRKTHDYIRKPGSFDLTLEKIKCINNAGITSVIMTTVSGTNIKEIPEIIDLVVKNEVDVFAFARYCPTSQEKEVNIEPLEYRDLLDKCYKKFQEYKDSKTHFNMKEHLWNLYLYEEGIFKIDKTLDESLIYDGCHLRCFTFYNIT
jgi:radical SAM/SPASM domain protein of ACGX system